MSKSAAPPAGAVEHCKGKSGHAARRKYAAAASSQATVTQLGNALLHLAHARPRGFPAFGPECQWSRSSLLDALGARPHTPHTSPPFNTTYSSYGSSNAFKCAGRRRFGLAFAQAPHFLVRGALTERQERQRHVFAVTGSLASGCGFVSRSAMSGGTDETSRRHL
jgi:hypothetical protein